MAIRARSIIFFILILVVLAAGALFYLSSNLNGIVAGIIETQGSAATQTAVRVDGVDINLPGGAASLAGLSIDNPEGFDGTAIELGALDVVIDTSSLTDDAIVINRIAVDGARVNLVQQGMKNNLQGLLANLQELGSGEAPTDSEGGKRLIIDQFTLSNASASLTLPGLGEAREVELPPIVVNDIGRASNGVTGAQVAQQLLKPLLDEVIASAATGSIKERAGEEINKALGGMLDRFGKKRDKDDG